MRAAVLAATLPLAACAGPSGEPIDCALDGAAAFSATCRLERSGAAVVLVRPDGGFRRLVEVGGRLTTSDGAAAAGFQRDARGLAVVTIGRDRYRFAWRAQGAAR